LKIVIFDYYTQSVSILTIGVESVRKLEINIGYNMQRLSVPTIHILLPNENKGRYNTIGLGEEQGEYTDNPSVTTIEKNKTFVANYHLMITSDNSNEVLTIYYWLRAMFIMFSEHVEFEGLHNMDFSGADIQMQQDLTPPGIFHRNLSVSFDFQTNIKIKIPTTLITKLKFGVCDNLAVDIANYQ
jgi:hypothetical protein